MLQAAWRPAASIALVIAAVSVLGSVLVSVAGASPAEAGQQMIEDSFGSMFNVGQTLTNAVPLILVALAWIVSFRAGRIHVGFPGQILIGGLLCTIVAIHLDGLPGIIHLPLTLLAAVVGGALWAGIAAFLWAVRGVLEIVSTLLLNLVAFPIVAWSVRGPLQQSVGNQPQTDPLPDSARWPSVPGIEGQTLSWDIILIPLLVVLALVFMYRTTAGFQQRLVGVNPEAAKRSGYSPTRVGVVSLVASGALAGLAGASLLLSGSTPGMTEAFEGETGFNGLAVALLAYNSPVAAVLAGIFFSALEVGSDGVEAVLGVPSTIVFVLQGLVVLFAVLTATVLARRNREQGGGE